MLTQVGRVRLVKGRNYEFSCQLRAEGISGRSVSVAISDTRTWQNCGLQTSFPLNSEWKACRRVFRATQDVGPDGRLQIWFTETGTLFVAEVRISSPFRKALFPKIHVGGKLSCAPGCITLAKQEYPTGRYRDHRFQQHPE